MRASPLVRVLRHALLALCVLAMLLPATGMAAAQSTDPRGRQHELQRELERAREGLQEVERRRVVTVADLEVIDAERARLDAELVALGHDLAQAQGVLDAAEAQLAATTAELRATEDDLAATHDALADRRAAFAGRARAAYISGGTVPVATLLDASDIAELGRQLAYVEVVLRRDRDQVTDVAGLVRVIEAETRRLEAIRLQEQAARAVAEHERDRVAEIVAAQREVRSQVAAEQERHRLTLVQLESDKDSYETLMAGLEQESARIEAELRRRAEEERRRAEARRSAARGVAAAATVVGSGQLQRPAAGRVTSGYGWRTHPIFGSRRFHAGVDFGGGHGAPIYAADSGVVVSAGARGGYGNTIVLDHGGGLTTLYAHQQRFLVSAGQRVERGQQIGEIGSTGYSTGPHLHFEVRVNGATRDPMPYL
jgi:murein DD-endopeptidase MepM/ murein hydrolase activator NlpD